jgi:hypothetical protein
VVNNRNLIARYLWHAVRPYQRAAGKRIYRYRERDSEGWVYLRCIGVVGVELCALWWQQGGCPPGEPYGPYPGVDRPLRLGAIAL